MAFIDNIRDIFGIGIDEITSGAVVTVYIGKGVHIEGNVKVTSFSSDQISLKLKKHTICITGKDLRIYEIDNYDVYVIGEVIGLSRGAV